jgi:hypothetical protein
MGSATAAASATVVSFTFSIGVAAPPSDLHCGTTSFRGSARDDENGRHDYQVQTDETDR